MPPNKKSTGVVFLSTKQLKFMKTKYFQKARVRSTLLPKRNNVLAAYSVTRPDTVFAVSQADAQQQHNSTNSPQYRWPSPYTFRTKKNQCAVKRRKNNHRDSNKHNKIIRREDRHTRYAVSALPSRTKATRTKKKKKRRRKKES